METNALPRSALKYDVSVTEGGKIELTVPFPVGAQLVVFVVRENQDSFAELLAASESSLNFWDNPHDDEDWNDA